MNQEWHHILSTDPIVISCDINMNTYFIAGEEVVQDEIIMALAETFDNETERGAIADEVSHVRNEMEWNEMREKDIQMTCYALAGRPQYLDY